MFKNYKIYIVISCLLIFCFQFFRVTTSDLPLIFEKDLKAHDESSNSVVAANVTRVFFPPKVRINPLEEKQGVWMEGPYWQHIPPLFAYVPYVFFQLDGEVTIEVKRLAFAFLNLISGLIFIISVYLFSKKLLYAVAATLAAIIWIINPFTRALVTGYSFGVSDIVLAFTIVCSFGGLLWYFSQEKEKRLSYAGWKIVLIAVICALPIMAKNLLGAIPAATLFIVLIYEHRTLNQKFWVAVSAFLSLLTLHYLPLYLASPETFKKEVLVAFFHFADLEGWGRPWYYYLTEYLPKIYLFKWTWVYYAGLVLAIIFSLQYSEDRKIKILLRLSIIWFFWNLVAITLVESKIANFIFQTYLLSLFAVVLPIFILAKNFTAKIKLFNTIIRSCIIVLMLLVVVLAGQSAWTFRKAVGSERGKNYVYDTEREKFYQAAEDMKRFGLTEKDLVIIRVSDNDCWFRYPILFLTGSEAKTLLEMNFNQGLWPQIRYKYNRMLVVFGDKKLPNTKIEYTSQRFGEYNAFLFNTQTLSQENISQALTDILKQHEQDTLTDIERIKDDKTSCQWLVPDPILNAP